MHQLLVCAWPMVDWHLLTAIKLIKVSLLLHETDEMRVIVVDHCSLALNDGSFVHCLELVARFEVFTNVFRRLILLLFEIGKIRAFLDHVREFIRRIEDNVEESDGSTGIVGELLHVEQLLAVIFCIERFLFLLKELLLWFGNLEEQDDSLNWLRYHILCPIFRTQHIEDGIFCCVEAYIRCLVPSFST